MTLIRDAFGDGRDPDRPVGRNDAIPDRLIRRLGAPAPAPQQRWVREVEERYGADVAAEREAGLMFLTGRERDVLMCLSFGMTREMAAAVLGISLESVKSHVREAVLKTKAKNRTHAVAISLRKGFIH